MRTLSRYRETLNQWGLNNIPFRATPPEDMNELARIFYGREKELNVALPTLYEGRNVLVRGIWGVGKTAFIRYLLYRLKKESASLGQQLLILYISRFPDEDSEALFRALLFALAKSLAENIRKARQVWETLRGLQINHRHRAQVEGKVNLHLITLGGSWGREREERRQFQNAYPVLLELLDDAQKQYERVIIAIDDLDKKTPRAVQEILDDATDLLRGGEGRRGFLLTGRYISTVQNISDLMLGLFSETITLSRMTADELHHIAVNYLNTARQRPSEETSPFTAEVIARIAEYAYYIPRQFNLICERVMRRGAMDGVARIDGTTFPYLWHKVREEFSLELTPEIRRLLYVARRQGGLRADMDDATLEELGVETFVELLPLLKSWEGDLLIKDEEGRWIPSNLLPDDEGEM